MQRKIITNSVIFLLMVFFSILKPFAQQPAGNGGNQANPFSYLTIIKLNEVATKEDMDKVKGVLRGFGYRVHSHKINFERKQVLIRMRQLVSNDSLISAFTKAGYTAWYDAKEPILPADAIYGGGK